jgi:D-alanyl-D-alanine carboxypeptidase
MSQCEPARIAPRRVRSRVLTALVFVSAGLIGVVTGQPRTTVGEADGVLPVGVTVFDEESPAVTNLDSDLLHALRQAARDAAKYKIRIVVNSGWRSPKYQEHLLHEAVSKFGSEKRAARWVATAEASFHVSGDAVDIGPSKAAVWLSKRGSAYGLCRIYRNEPWHYELRPNTIKDACPTMYADARHDPRMQR